MPRRAAKTGDPVKLLGLLWTPSQAVGRSGSTVQGITEAAVRLADAEGLDAVTMRRVAEEVGVGAMTLYTYVPGRAELLELMLDRVVDEVYDGRQPPSRKRSWRPAVAHVAQANWEHHMSHPWTVDVSPGRPVLGPGHSTKYEQELRPLDGIGLADVEMDHVLTTVLGMVLSAARWQVGLDRVRAESLLTDEQWWRQAAPVFARAAERLDLTVAGRVGEAVGSAGEPKESLDHGLGLLLDGVEQRLSR